MANKIQGYEGPHFGIPNVDTTGTDYDPAEQFLMRFNRLRELSDDEVLFVGIEAQRLVSDLATFAASALRAGIKEAEQSGQDADAVLTSSGIDLINYAIMAAITNIETKTVMDGSARAVEVVSESQGVPAGQLRPRPYDPGEKVH